MYTIGAVGLALQEAFLRNQKEAASLQEDKAIRRTISHSPMWPKEEKVKAMNLVDPRISGVDHLSALSRIVTPQQRLSSAQRTLAAMNPVAVSMAHRHDPENLRRMAARALNLKLLLQHVFDDSIASMAAHLEMSPDRLRALIDLQTSFDPEIAEHLEHCLHLPGGWLDTRRTQIDAAHLKSIIFESAREEALAQDEAPREPKVFRVESSNERASQPAEPQGGATTSSATVAGNTPIVLSLPTSSNAMSATETSSALAEQAKKDPYAATKDHRLEGPLAQAMQWFSDRLSELEPKDASAVRLGLHEKLGRAQSTISTWTNNLRRLPDDVQVPMVRAIIEMRLPFAAEFLQRMSEASPHLFTQEVKRQLEEMLQRMPADTQRWTMKSDKKNDKPAAGSPQKTAGFARGKQDHQTTVSASNTDKEEIVLASHSLAPASGPGVPGEDFRLVVARAAEKVADVLQYIVRQPH